METITEGETSTPPDGFRATFAFDDNLNLPVGDENDGDDEEPHQERMPSAVYSSSIGRPSNTTSIQTTSIHTHHNPSMVRRRRTSAMMFEEIQKEHRESTMEKKQCTKQQQSYCGPFFGGSLYHPGCPHCADRDRDHIRQFRQLAQDYPNIYSWICVDPEDFSRRWPKELIFVFLGISIQVVTPIAIAIQFHKEIPDGGYCRQWIRDGHDVDMGRYLAFVLALYFGVVSMHTFLGKLRGNAFLMMFSSINTQRKTILVIGFLAQLLGLIAANIAEYFLFVSRGRQDYLILLFTSTTMQATLNADSNNLISTDRANRLEDIVSKILSDECLDLGENGDPDLPKELTTKLIRFRLVYDVMTFFLLLFVFCLTVLVTHCI